MAVRSIRAGRAAGVSLAGLLLASVSTSALAAPPSDARLDAMQQQLDALRAQLNELRAAGNTDAKLTAMQTQLDALAQELAEVKTAQAADAANIFTLQTPTGGTTTASLPNGKPALATADGRFTANIRAIVMYDIGKYFQDENLPPQVNGRDLNEGSNFRRARFGVDGKLFRDFDYALIYEFGGSGAEDGGHIQEAWVQYSALKPLRIRLGAFEPNIGLAAAVSTSQMPMMERPSSAEIARNVAAGDSRSGLQVAGAGVWGQGDVGLATRWFFSTAITGNIVGTINSTGGATAQPLDEQTAWIARAVVSPFYSTDWQAHLGINYQYVIHPNDAGATVAPRTPIQLRDRPELRIDGTRLVDTGAIDVRHASVVGLEGAFLARNFTLEGEWFKYGLDRRQGATPAPDPDFDGYYLEGTWVLTGETRVYNAAEARIDAPRLNTNFDPETGSWGAIELAARYSVVDLNYRAGSLGAPPPLGGVRGGEQKIFGLGVNWYLNPAIRFMVDWQHVDVDRLGATGLQVGQDFDTLAMRSQLTF